MSMSLNLEAHQPDLSTTMLIEQEDGSWLLQIRAALTAFKYEVKTKYGDEAYASPEEFKSRVLEHIKNNFNITFNKTQIAQLDNPYVKLGHETNVVFQLKNVPDAISAVQIHNSTFAEIHNNQSALIVFGTEGSKNQFILNNENDHTQELLYNGKELIASTTFEEAKGNIRRMKYGTSFVLLSFIGIYFSIIKNREKNHLNID